MDKSHDQLRADAIAAAHAIVVAEGVGGLTVRRVALEIGCSVGTIYNLFQDLDELVIHVASRVVDAMHAALLAEPMPADPVERLHALGRRYLSFAFEHPRLWSMLFEYGVAQDRPTPDWYSARIERLVVDVQAAATPAFSDSAGEARRSVEVLWASVHGIAALAMRGKLGFVTAESAFGLAERLIATYLAGLAGAAAAPQI